MKVDNVVTGIVVSWNTKDLIERAYSSIRKFHPFMKIIIVDGSDRSNDCFKYVSGLTNNINTRVFHVDQNIGHGRGLCVGIEKAETQYALIFDSDIEMLKSPVQEIMDMMEDGTYGVGYTEKTAFDGHEWGCNPIHKTQGWMRYLHPYFCLIDLIEYKKYRPFIHHGAPAVNTMLDIHRRGLGDKVIKEFPGLGHSSGKGWVWEGKPREFIKHDTQGTRAFRVSKGMSEIEGIWEKVDKIDKRASNVTCITATGDRPLAFSLCRKWMRAQTVSLSQWIVVDDGKYPIGDTKSDNIDYIRREPRDDDPKHTMILNLKEAFRAVQGSRVLFIEDDEYYAPTYIEEMLKKLEEYELVGIGRSKYYYLPTFKYGVHFNIGHASLAQTAFNTSIFNDIKDCLDGDSYLDIRIWSLVNEEVGRQANSRSEADNISSNGRGIVFDDRESSLYVGMKGLPGRLGIGSGHFSNQSFYHNDVNKSVLSKWIPKKADFETYTHLFESIRRRISVDKGLLVGTGSKTI